MNSNFSSAPKHISVIIPPGNAAGKNNVRLSVRNRVISMFFFLFSPLLFFFLLNISCKLLHFLFFLSFLRFTPLQRIPRCNSQGENLFLPTPTPTKVAVNTNRLNENGARINPGSEREKKRSGMLSIECERRCEDVYSYIPQV